ncbi:unnamed protein product [Phaedon cochleariae]|uniref:ER membrane protein complex subunit 10 n=1 Tax=Phaedon cochleariae TaxID=80249 RepID=A0A9P0GSV7_PHACE|nr:unnamed protein product [Phaedon cochleariae]
MLSLIKIISVLSSLVLILASNLEHDGSATIRLQHSLTLDRNQQWVERGNISIYSLRLGQAVVKQNPLTPQEQKQLQDLAVSNKLYQVRSVVTTDEGSERSFISTVKACMLAESELDDRLSVSLDYTGRIIAVSLVVASKSTCEGAFVPLDKLKEFTTSVYVRQAETGPIPDTATFIQKLEREREAKEKGETKDNRSFFAKYWMYIVPLLIFMAISSASNPDAPQAQ